MLTSENLPVFSAIGSTRLRWLFWYFFTYFLRQGGPRIPVLCNAWFVCGCMLCVSFRDFLADVPVVLVVQVLLGAVVEETVELRQLHSSRSFLRGAAHQRVDELMG